jgi:transcription elongation factor GreA
VKRRPCIQGLGWRGATLRGLTEDNQITPEGLEALKAEIAHLEGVERPAIAERIKTAREWGDLKENAEYHDAKNSQAFLETRIKSLNERLRAATVVEEAPVANGEVGFGATVELRDEEAGKTVTYRIVGSTEASLADGKLSVESPVAQALMGSREGAVVAVPTPRGERRYTVLSVS